MKAEELMIGDWVMYNPNVFVDDEYESTKDYYPIQISNGEDIDLAIEGCYQPIPLTYEILKKNGGIMSDTLAKFDIGNYYVIYEYDGFLTICEDNYNERKISYIDCKYVHQLQHALRLCGINKEIVL